MKFEKAKEKTPKNGDKNISLTPSAVLLKRRLGDAPAPRMLTRYEIELLRQCVEETAQITREVLKRECDTSQD